MTILTLCLLRGALLVVALCSAAIAQTRYFYTGKNYGSEAAFNPISVILNGGFDVLQLPEFSRHLNRHPYRIGSREVLHNLKHPVAVISRYGWGHFIKDQVVPFNKIRQNVQWWPNYHLHLIGGGMEYAMMSEWYEAHGLPAPRIWAAATSATYHFINETIENREHTGGDVDAIADIYLFDIGGIILFSMESVQRFFSKELHLADWSLQPSFSLADGTLRNAGQYFSMKWHPASWTHWQVFYYFGLNGIVGPSYRFSDNSALSAGVGMRSSNREVLDATTNKQTVQLTWNAGIFYDRNNSLLASLTVSGLHSELATANVYPGVFSVAGMSPGVWASVTRHLSPSFGVAFRWIPGLAWTDRHRGPDARNLVY